MLTTRTLMIKLSLVFACGGGNDTKAPETKTPETKAASDTARAATTPTRHRINWAELLRRVFAIDVLRCGRCANTMRILAVINEGDASRAILEHLQLPTEPPRPRSLDPPPYS